MNAIDLITEIGGNLDGQQEIVPAEPVEPTEPVTLAYEHLQAREPEIQKFLDTHLKIENIRSSETVSREMAMEVFTMLPPMVNIETRLTHRPSVHNKSFVLDQIKSWDKNEEIRSFLIQLSGELFAVRSAGMELKQICETFLKLAVPEFTRLEAVPPMVVDMESRRPHNLLTADISEIVYTPDSVYGYPEYTGTLQPKFEALRSSLVLKINPSLTDPAYQLNNVTCLAGIYRHLKMIADSYEQFESRYQRTLEQLQNYSDQNTPSMKYVVEDALAIIRDISLDSLQFQGDDCLASNTVEVLKFLK